MKKMITTCFLLFVLTWFVTAQPGDEKLVKDAFEKYKTAILNDKGDEAIKYVDSRTIKYYGDMLDLVKNADSLTLEKRNILDKLMVFSIRLRASKDDIKTFTGRTLLVFAIESGMVGKNGVTGNAIGAVTVDKNFARGQFIVNNQKTPFYFQFYKEDAQWKVDLTSLFALSTASFQKMADESGKKVNDYLFSVLEITSGKQPGQDIWQPVK